MPLFSALGALQNSFQQENVLRPQRPHAGAGYLWLRVSVDVGQSQTIVVDDVDTWVTAGTNRRNYVNEEWNQAHRDHLAGYYFSLSRGMARRTVRRTALEAWA